MSLSLFAEWRAATARGELQVRLDLLNRFERWISSKGLTVESLDRETYLSMYALDALEGKEPRQFTETDRQIRKWYRWAARQNLIPNIPFGDVPLGEKPPALLPVVSEEEVFLIVQHGTRLANDAGRSPTQRRRAGRAALTAAMIYFMGIGQREMSAMNADVLVALADHNHCPEILARAAHSYRALFDYTPMDTRATRGLRA